MIFGMFASIRVKHSNETSSERPSVKSRALCLTKASSMGAPMSLKIFATFSGSALGSLSSSRLA